MALLKSELTDLRGIEPMVREGSGNRLAWPDHISDETLEKMTVYLLEDESRGQVFHQYCVCVYVKAIMRLYNFSRVSTNKSMHRHFANARKQYEVAAIHALRQLDILAMPSLSLIQALLSAVSLYSPTYNPHVALTFFIQGLLVQSLGRANHAWVLCSYASRLIVSLNYHETSDPSTGDEDVKSALYWCYYLDRTLSTLLIRPPSLPNLQVSPTDLVRVETSVPYTPLIRIIIDLSQIQDQLLDISLHGKRRSAGQILAHCQGLQERMCIIYTNLQAVRESHPSNPNTAKHLQRTATPSLKSS